MSCVSPLACISIPSRANLGSCRAKLDVLRPVTSPDDLGLASSTDRYLSFVRLRCMFHINRAMTNEIEVVNLLMDRRYEEVVVRVTFSFDKSDIGYSFPPYKFQNMTLYTLDILVPGKICSCHGQPHVR